MEAVILYVPRLYWYETDNRWYLVASSYLVFLGVYWLIFQSIGAIVDKNEGRERERFYTLQKTILGGTAGRSKKRRQRRPP